MIDPKYIQLLFAFLMALFMSGVMSLVITLYNIGLVDGIVAFVTGLRPCGATGSC